MSKTENEKEQLICEYERANDLIIFYQDIAWKIGSIFIPVSIGLIAFSFTIENITAINVALLAAASLLLYVLWPLFAKRTRFYNNTIYERIFEIEEKLDGPLPKNRQIR